jgi:hypothetical protein
MAVKAALKENSYGNRTRVKTGKVRLSFPHLFDRYDKSGKYQAVFIVPKDSDTQKVIDEAVKNAKLDGKTRLWGGKVPGRLDISMKDGDEPNDDGDIYPENEGNNLVTAKSNTKPAVFDTDGSDIFDEEDIYSGCYVQAIFEVYPYNNDSKGIAFALSGVKKVSDGEHLGGGGYKAGADDFDEVDEDDGDDLML